MRILVLMRLAYCASLILFAIAGCSYGATDADELARRASLVLRSDWNAAPGWAFLQRDEFETNGRPASKTHQVVMIDGSDYYMPVAINDQPLAPEQRRNELLRLRDEVARRSQEDSAARAKRVANYRQQREQNGHFIVEFPEAFRFTLSGEETTDTGPAIVLNAVPLKKSGTLTREQKILAAMSGTIHLDAANYHVISAEGTVSSPVSIYGIFARVQPGTHMMFEMTPVSPSVWLIRRYAITVKVTKFLFFDSTSTTVSTYSGYRDNEMAVQELLAEAAADAH